jgi:hypothetical protein
MRPPTTTVGPSDDSLASYLARHPITLRLGAMVGMAMRRHYTWGFLLNRVLDRVEQFPQIALCEPPVLFLSLLPSLVSHQLRPYVVDEGQGLPTYLSEADRAARRYTWETRCGRCALRVHGGTHQVVPPRDRVALYHTLPPWCTPCVACTALLRRARTERARA